jgi:hypothetical protein
MLSETSYQCAKCGATEGCLCRLQAATAPADKVVAKETERSFTEEPVGTKVRRPKGTVEVCPLCEHHGVHVVIPRWRRRHGRDQWIHEARISSVGYEVIESCEREVPLKNKKRSRK